MPIFVASVVRKGLATLYLKAYTFFDIIHSFSSALHNMQPLLCSVTAEYIDNTFRMGGLLHIHSIKPPSSSVCPPTATHSQIMLLHSLKKANYQLPLLITDSGVPPLSNNTEVKVQVCVCKKNKMQCSSAHSHSASLLVLLVTLLLALLCKYYHTTTEKRWSFI